jgi:hypothetical protein
MKPSGWFESRNVVPSVFQHVSATYGVLDVTLPIDVMTMIRRNERPITHLK